MSYSARIVNPTPIDISWKFHKGIEYKIPAFGHMDIPASVMEQLMPDQPGYDGIRQEMEHFGVFLRDNSRTYESQAEEALKASIRSKKSLYDDCEKGVRKRAADSGNLKEEAIQNELERCGYTRLAGEVEKLHETLKVIQAVNVKNKRTMHDQYDPEKTLLFCNPPKTFESPMAMKLFLMQPENEALKRQQEKFLAQMSKPTKSELKSEE